MNNNVTTCDELTIHKFLDNQIAIADYMKSSAENFDNAGIISQTNEVIASDILIYSDGLPIPEDEDFTPETVAVADAVAQAYLSEVLPLAEPVEMIVSELGVWPSDGDSIASEFLNGVGPDYEEELETWTPPPYREVIIHNDVQIFADSGEVVPWWNPQYVIRTEQDVKDAFKRLREAEKAILREEADLEIERKDFEEKKKSFEARIKPLERKRAYIEMRMSADLKPHLADLVESGKLKKVKYIDTGYGRYSVGDVPEKIEIVAENKQDVIDYCTSTPELTAAVWEQKVIHLDKRKLDDLIHAGNVIPGTLIKITPAEKNGNFKIKTGLR